MENTMMIYLVGLLSQLSYSARMLCQWILSEKAKRVLSPAVFWYFSLLGAYLMFLYGCLRDDFAVILGPLIAYYIYIWNLNKKGHWKKWHLLLRVIVFMTPVMAILYLLKDVNTFVERFFRNDDIPLGLLLFGSLGQIILTCRFIYQWLYSKQKNESLLPLGFWIISLIGSLVVVSYALYRKDPIMILGQVSGLFVYSRNIYLDRHTRNLFK